MDLGMEAVWWILWLILNEIEKLLQKDSINTEIK